MVQANGQAPQSMLSLLEGIGSLIQTLVTLIGVAAFLVPYSAWLPLVLLASTLPAFWVVVTHRTKYHDWWEESTERRRWRSRRPLLRQYAALALTPTDRDEAFLPLPDHLPALYYLVRSVRLLVDILRPTQPRPEAVGAE